MRPLSRYQREKMESAFRRAFRDDARKAQSSRCTYCFEPITTSTATADHVKARAEAGLDHRNNIVAACRRCNSTKGRLSEKEFRRRIEAPRSGESLSFWVIWACRRINLRLIAMARNLGAVR